jgi:hypothetical protein
MMQEVSTIHGMIAIGDHGQPPDLERQGVRSAAVLLASDAPKVV